MYSNRAETGSEIRPTSSLRDDAAPGLHRTLSTLLPQRLTRARAALQPNPRRLRLATALAVLAIAAFSAAEHSGWLLQQASLHTTVAPLAPPPPAPAPPSPAPHPHRLLHSLHPLAGLASWYGGMWNGRTTASGEVYDGSQLTAAHRTLPLGTLVRVTNLRSMHSVIVRINDRGAFAPGRIIDLSSAAADELGMLQQGLAQVSLEVLRKR